MTTAESEIIYAPLRRYEIWIENLILHLIAIVFSKNNLSRQRHLSVSE